MTGRSADGKWLRRTSLGATCRKVAHHVVVDLQHAGDLVERLRSRGEEQQVVVAVSLLVDLVGELALAPCIVARERAATLLDQVTHARDDLRLRLLGEVWVQQQQDLVVDHGFPFLLPSVLGGLTGKHELGMARAWRGRKRDIGSICSQSAGDCSSSSQSRRRTGERPSTRAARRSTRSSRRSPLEEGALRRR